jgi:hypothetical protein
MKKIITGVILLLFYNINTQAQPAGHVVGISNTTDCDVTIRPLCLTNGTTSNPCDWGSGTWSNGSPTLTCPANSSISIWPTITHGCGNPTDTRFYQICWNTANCNSCVYIVHPSIATQITCQNLVLTGDENIAECEDCCPNGARVWWRWDDVIQIDCW